jgi:LmbE family N-acetylglucosaminyl deacetylase
VRVLWVGAHPDDELFVAGWLAALSIDERAEIGFLVATSGERGSGFLDRTETAFVAQSRERELIRAAELFRATVVFAGLRDATGTEPESVLSAWAKDMGGIRALKHRFRSLILEFAPDRIVTFDRRHGCTWHADHRAVGAIVQSLALPIPVTLAQSRTDFRPPLRFSPGARNAERVDVRDTWDTVVRVIECHASQFGPDVVQRFREVSDDEKVVWLLHLPRWRAASYFIGNVMRLLRRGKSWLRDRWFAAG